jgi:hypothetical protein
MISARFENVVQKMRAGIYLAWILLAQLAAGCATSTPYVPLSIPSDEFNRTANTIALAPVLPPQGIQIADTLLANMDALIEETLVSAGYSCVSSREHAALWDRIVVQMGGLYDSLTGEVDELRLEVAREQLRRDLADMYQPDYVLFPEIWMVRAAASGGVASWDGASQPVVGFGTRVLNAIDAILNQYDGFLQPEVVDALSLGVVVESMQGVEIFQSAGGIEVLKEMERHTEFESVLTDPERNRQAVTTALLPLLEGREGGQPEG